MLVAILMGESFLILLLLGGSLALYLAASRRFRLLAVDGRRAAAGQAAVRRAFEDRLVRLEAGLRELESSPPLSAPTVGANALSLQKRSQALKMIRRGEPPDTVAAALGVPRNQIQLLLKVQGLIAS